MATKPLPSQEVLRQLLDYDPETGKLFWKERGPEWFKSGKKTSQHNAAVWNSRHSGKEAFTARNVGYCYGSIMDQMTLGHRVIWKWVTGDDPDQIDHINGVRDDNRWSNIRNVDAQENCRNNCIRSDNTSGMTGVYRTPVRGGGFVWTARIGRQFIGQGKCWAKVVAARKKAEAEMGFHKNHGRAG